MDVYLQPLINELKELWEGIQIYDALISIPSEMIFKLNGICAYITHDYPWLGVFSSKYVV